MVHLSITTKDMVMKYGKSVMDDQLVEHLVNEANGKQVLLGLPPISRSPIWG